MSRVFATICMLLGFIPVLIGALVGFIIGPFYHGFIAGLDIWRVIADENAEQKIQEELEKAFTPTDQTYNQT